MWRTSVAGRPCPSHGRAVPPRASITRRSAVSGRGPPSLVPARLLTCAVGSLAAVARVMGSCASLSRTCVTGHPCPRALKPALHAHHLPPCRGTSKPEGASEPRARTISDLLMDGRVTGSCCVGCGVSAQLGRRHTHRASLPTRSQASLRPLHPAWCVTPRAPEPRVKSE